jgi:hypothetical protein
LSQWSLMIILFVCSSYPLCGIETLVQVHEIVPPYTHWS